jgi:hypothetical protein
LVLAYRDPVAIAKKLFEVSKELSKENPLAKIKGALMGGRFLKPQEVQALAELPPREVLLSKLMGTLAGSFDELYLSPQGYAPKTCAHPKGNRRKEKIPIRRCKDASTYH